MTEETLHLMQMPRNRQTERIIQLTRHAVEQLERQDPLSSLHGTRSRATATVVPQASRTPRGHHRQLQQQNQRNQEEQEVASSHRPRGGNLQQTKLQDLNKLTTTTVDATAKK